MDGARILVAGVGNVLHGDDGFGVELAWRLARRTLPEGVTVLETGIAGMTLVQELMQGYDGLLLLDAHASGGAPGTVRLLEPRLPDLSGLDPHALRDYFADTHYATPLRALALLERLGHLPRRIAVLGCEPAQVAAFQLGLSDAVRKALEAAEQAALGWIARWREPRAEVLRIAGLVQGVGMRPTVWRLAQRFGLRGTVANDGAGVRVHAVGSAEALDAFVAALRAEAPPLARIDAIAREPAVEIPAGAGFRIVASGGGAVRTGVLPDAATCADCLAEIDDPQGRRWRYPFTNCTHCGPRVTLVEGVPYDRARTTMAAFALCGDCRAEYDDPADRRFHAQPIACPACGPRLWLARANGAVVAPAAVGARDAIDAAAALLRRGEIVAVKGLGGFQLACDARQPATVAALRLRKQREARPFALMLKDVAMVRQVAEADAVEAALLAGPAAPIVLLRARLAGGIAPGVAPGLDTLGCMLPATPLHHLLLRAFDGPLVLTSGNRSDEPQAIDDEDARDRLGAIADAFLVHDRGIARRMDDSVLRVVAGVPMVLRRARGFAPAPLALAPGFAAAPPVLALGGELKNTFCLLRDGQATLSHHIGDLAHPATHADWLRALEDHARLFAHEPRVVAVDAHPDYRSSQHGRAWRGAQAVVEVQHHHAHIASCLAENGRALDAAPVLGIALDGLGWAGPRHARAGGNPGLPGPAMEVPDPRLRGADDALQPGQLWGGEFLLADYRTATRLAHLRAAPLLGGEQAIHEPWRNACAQLAEAIGWPELQSRYGRLDIVRFLATQPVAALERMRTSGLRSPPCSSCGRLFDAVAAVLGICREHAAYEGQAAMLLEALATGADDHGAYPFAIADAELQPGPLWPALLDDLLRGVPQATIALRFHRGLADGIARMVDTLQDGGFAFDTIALSGGVFQNRLLSGLLLARLRQPGRTVLVHRQVPASDGGLALGQAAVAAARVLAGDNGD